MTIHNVWLHPGYWPTTNTHLLRTDLRIPIIEPRLIELTNIDDIAYNIGQL